MREKRSVRKRCRCAALDPTSYVLFFSAGVLFLYSLAFGLLSHLFPFFC